MLPRRLEYPGTIMKTIHVIVTGNVQGVGFRHYTRLEAKRLGLAGWVRNLADVRVEALLRGNDTQLNAMLSWLKTGSPLASVDSIAEEMAEEDHSLISFDIRY